jgi:hypothetical protein
LLVKGFCFLRFLNDFCEVKLLEDNGVFLAVTCW